MAHHPVHIDTNQRFELSSKAQTRLILGILVGIVMVVLGCFIAANSTGHDEHQAPTHETHAEAAAAAHHEAVADPKSITGHHEEVAPTEEAALEHHAEKGHDAAADGGHHEAVAGGHHEAGWWQRFIAVLWMHSVFFTGISVIGIFFTAVQYVAMAGWSAGLKRVFLAVGSFVPVGLVLILITFLIGKHDLFHWTHSDLFDPNSPEYDEIIAGKSWYLSVPFFLARLVVFGILWVLLGNWIRKNSLREDSEGGSAMYKKNQRVSAAFLVVFAVSSSMLAWDWLMSIDTHWYSTLFGWYTFASWFVSGLAVITLTTIFLKERGLMTHINENHLHDLGKFMFAFSIFWTYLWTAQFLLIWYAGIPEEAIYYNNRLYGLEGHYQGPFFLNLFINFVFPFLFLMPRPAKRTMIFLKIAAFGILMGHWIDFYQMIMPGTLGVNNGWGLLEFGMLIAFVSALILMISRALASAPLVAKNHPMLEESLSHDI